VARVALILCALTLACMEGAAVARAVKPRPRTLLAPGVVAQVPWLLVPMKPGVAGLPGVVEAHLRREDRPLQILPGEDAVRIGERTWLRRRSSQDGEEEAVYEAADGGGTLVIEFWCRDAVCRGAAGEAMVAQIARTARSLQ
jgi:hypothetical protein